MTGLAVALRLAVLAALVVLAFRPPLASTPSREAARVPANSGDPVDWTAAAPALWTRADSAVPAADALKRLAALGARAPLLASAPARAATARLTPPRFARAERAAALGWESCGHAPRATVRARLSERGAPIDSASGTTAADGCVRGSFRVRPATGGWHHWRLRVGRADAQAGVWVAPATPLRLVVFAGPPSWESRFTVRALEEGGAQVRLIQSLGSAAPVDSAAGAAATVAALDGADAVLILPDGRPPAAVAAALPRFVEERGGGLVVVGDPRWAAPLGVVGGRVTGQARGGVVRWNVPPEISPLPSSRAELSVPIGPARPGTLVAATGTGGPVLALRTSGLGRVAVLGLSETWRWRMEEGLVDAHRAFWTDLTGWAGGAWRGDERVLATQSIAAGAPVTVRVVRWRSAEGGGAPTVTLSRPDGSREVLGVAADSAGRAWHAAFLPTGAGVYRIRTSRDTAGAAVQHDPQSTGPAPWAELAGIAARSGGGMAPGTALDDSVAARLGSASRAPRWRDPALWLALLVAALGAEWTIRRLAGRP